MSKSTTAMAAPIKPEDYKHSPIHYAVATGDHATLSRIVSSLPRLADPSKVVLNEADSLAQERIADKISTVLDCRDNPHRETPLHLAVRLNDVFAARTLASAGANISLQNATGWNALQDAMIRRCSDVSIVLLQHQHVAAWHKWRRRLPRLIAALRRMRDFYMEISFHFESSIVPFVGKIAPSDTYKIWKRDGNLRADTSLAGFDGMKVQRADQSFLFLGDGDSDHDVPPGSLLVINRDERKIFDAFENAGNPMTESDVAGYCSQTSVYRPGMDVTQAELVGRTNWRRQEKTENVGEWKARVYEVHNVVFSYRSKKIIGTDSDLAGSEQILPLELDEDTEDGFLVAENPHFSFSDDRHRHSSFVREDRRRHSSFVREDRRHSSFIREDNDIVLVSSRNSVDIPSSSSVPDKRRQTPTLTSSVVPPQTKEKDYVKSLRPSIWLTDQFPLKTEELLPLLDILANKVKAVRRMRDLLTTKFPPGTFPVKLAIPVVPTVKVVITFTKFTELQQPIEHFYTPLSSPRLFSSAGCDNETDKSSSSSTTTAAASSATAWLRRSNSKTSLVNKKVNFSLPATPAQQSNPFAIPSGYRWSSFDEKTTNKKTTKKSKSSGKKTI
ncbi:ankyrin repeat domain-containing protein 13A-like [Impatiens glandulifera]|uniref:ankyrin repeat domain-containing protein 13A-like n=1 Tax=Impatiens glandulifera TaxID=253017 RepID=UPI001FB18C3D|nr:ankyrin repeat domain-containing protein 13A-like [Impatiens glandulifera]